jgi:hypothetical protein
MMVFTAALTSKPVTVLSCYSVIRTRHRYLLTERTVPTCDVELAAAGLEVHARHPKHVPNET